jgi:ERCC4-type nuclease
MIIKVDVREKDLLQHIKHLIETVPIFKNIVIQSEVLSIGDIIIVDPDADANSISNSINPDKENKELLIIERKSVSDLLASIKDGRYEEQSYRLNGSPQHNHNIIYLIEGDVKNTNRFKVENGLGTEKITLYSAMFSLNYYKGFSVFRSFNLGETAIIICNMAYKLEKDKDKKEPFYKNNKNADNKNADNKNADNKNADNKILEDTLTNEETLTNEDTSENVIDETDKHYVSVVKKVKKENITPDNIGEIMLCQIPGISSVIALTIMEQFKTLPNLITELDKNPECLKNISSTNSKGQVRKINKTALSNIVKFLLKK